MWGGADRIEWVSVKQRDQLLVVKQRINRMNIDVFIH